MSGTDQGMIGLIVIVLVLIWFLQIFKNFLRRKAAEYEARAEEARFISRRQAVSRSISNDKKSIEKRKNAICGLLLTALKEVEEANAKKAQSNRTSCVNCGAPYEDGKFCGYCGTRKDV